MMKCTFFLTGLLVLASQPVWGQEYHDHIMEYQLDAEQAEQLSQNEQAREMQYAQELRMQSMQQRLDDLEFQRLMKEREKVSDPRTYFPQ